jgi:tetratricopeptide (TPR) repeat protein
MTNDPPVEATPVVEVVPFWSRIGETLRYPLHPAALSMICGMAVLHLVRYLPFGFLLDVLVWVAMYKYAFECLRATANGDFEPRELSVEVDDSLGWKQIVLQFLFSALGIVTFAFVGHAAGVIVLLILGFALPGAIMSLAMDENLEHALNPATWLAILTRLGWPYVVLVALCFGFFAIQNFAQAIAFWVLPSFLALIVVSAVAHYVIVATFHMMGYLIHQYQAEVGYTPPAHDVAKHRTGADPQQGLLDEADRLARDGRADAACDLIGVELRGRGGSEAMHARYGKLLAQLGRREEQLRHGHDWIATLLALGNERRAVEVARESLAIDPSSEPVSADDVARLSRKAADIGASQVALTLIANLRHRHPEHPDNPRNGLFAAKLLAERLGRDDEARAMLDDIIQSFPGDALAKDATAYRGFLDKLGASRRAPGGREPDST